MKQPHDPTQAKKKDNPTASSDVAAVVERQFDFASLAI